MADYAIHEETLTDIADVLRKKDGSVALIDPSDFAAKINLLGPLPEKTVSGAIVTFADGADTVPLKKCEITLPASLDGYSQVNVIHAGKNILKNQGTKNINGIDWVYDSASGLFSISGTIGANVSDYYFFGQNAENADAFTAPSKMVLSTNYITNDSNCILGVRTSNGLLSNTGTQGTITIPQGTRVWGVFARVLNFTISMSDIYFQLEIANSSSAYEPYAPTTHTATLGRTIYGGSVDVVNGTAEPTNLLNVPAREEMTRNGIVSSISADGTITASGQSTGNGDIIVTLGKSVNLIGGETYTFSIIGTDTRSGSVYVYFTGGSYISINNVNHSGTYTPSADQTITGVTLRMFNTQTITLSAKIQLEKGSTSSDYSPNFEPFTFDPVPIDSKLGNNTLWSEQGSSAEVTYRADINLALGE